MRLPTPGPVLGAVLLVVLGGCAGPAAPDAPTARPTAPVTSSPTTTSSPSGAAAPTPAGEDCEYVRGGTAARPVQPPSATGIPDSGSATVVLRTGEGAVTLTLDRSRAPCTVNSFLSLVSQHYFDGTRCHRLVDSGIFVLQCGDPTATGSGGPGYTFPDETDGTESYGRGVVAMANAGPGTNGSQFFLVYDDSTSLDKIGGYTVFARMDAASVNVVARIAAEGQDGSNPAGGGVPNNPAEIVSARVVGGRGR